MIRINLLAPERLTQKRKAAVVPSGGGGGSSIGPILLFLLFVGGAVFGCGALGWMMTMRLRDLDMKIAAAQQERQQLLAIKAQVEAFERKKVQLEIRKLLIEKLRTEQRGPVHMLDEMSKALPDFVWLAAMEETAGNVRLKGEAASLAAVADFIAALQRSGWFSGMDLVSSQEQTNVVAFELAGRFVNPEAEAKDKELQAKIAASKPKPAPGARR